jgi:uncharacterized protein DUF4386
MEPTMTDPAVESSPQFYARIGGLLYLFIILAGGFAEGFVRSKLIVSGDATATANNIMASQSLWRIAFAGELALYGVRCCSSADPVCIAEAGEQKHRFAGCVFQPGQHRH